jgi:hypothetical protein
MDKLVWTTPTIDVLQDFRSLPFRGSDTSWVNLYLLRRKYKLEIAVHDGVLFRFYHGKTPNRQGYGFPLSANGFDAGKAFRLLEQDAESRGGIQFCLCDGGQKEIVSAFFGMEWDSDPGDADYIYERGKWIGFAGQKYHRLRNRMHSFNRLYPGAVYFPIDGLQRLQDALRVARIWQEEHQGLEEMPADDLEEEQNCILDAAEHWEELGMTGGVLYVEGEPVATTMASFLSADSLDFHFDKAVGPFAAAGATVVSRRHLAASGIGRDRPFFNLEEDVNIPGLRQSKETYRPVLKFSKFFGGKPC